MPKSGKSVGLPIESFYYQPNSSVRVQPIKDDNVIIQDEYMMIQ
jgi:hypothetical protein